MDLKTLHERTTIDRNLLRYCLDLKVIPGLQVRAAKHRSGRAREFDDKAALLIVCAALLIETGVPPRKVRTFFQALLKHEQPDVGSGSHALQLLVDRRLQGMAAMGDGAFFRLQIPMIAVESNWRKMDAPNGDSYLASPAVQVILDLEAVHYRLRSVEER